MSGRIAAIDAVAGDPLTSYAGAASGGVCKSKDGGLTWHGPDDSYGYVIDPKAYAYSAPMLLPDGDVYGDFGPARLWSYPPSIGTCHLELQSVHVDRMVGHGQIAHAHPHPFAEPAYQVIYPGKYAAIP